MSYCLDKIVIECLLAHGITVLDCKIEVSRITFYKITYDTFSSQPFLKHSLVIFDDLNFKIWYEGKFGYLERS